MLNLVYFPVQCGVLPLEFEGGSFAQARGEDAHNAIDIGAPAGGTEAKCQLRFRWIDLIESRTVSLAIRAAKAGFVPRTIRVSGGRNEQPRQMDGSGGSADGGNYVWIVDDDGYFHYYSHLRDKPLVGPGRRVQAGEPIGFLGRTGHSPGGPHLHYAVKGPLRREGREAEFESLRFGLPPRTIVNPFTELCRVAGSRLEGENRKRIPPDGPAAAEWRVPQPDTSPRMRPCRRTSERRRARR